MPDDRPTGAAEKTDLEAGPAESGAAQGEVGEKAPLSERDSDGVMVENGIEIVGLIGEDDPYS